MSKSERVVFVDVFINRIDPLDFKVVPSSKNNPQLPTGPNDEIIFDNDGHDGFEIHFELQGDTFGYFFPPHNNKHDAVWSQRGNVCPTQGVWEIFRPLRIVQSPVSGELRTLVVRNKNPGPPPGQGPFQYNLRVTNGSGWKDLDPGGTNNDGSTRSVDWSYAAVGAITGIASSLITLLAVAQLGLVCPSAPGF